MAPATPGIHHATAITGDPDENVTSFPWTGDGRPGAFGAGQTRMVAYRIPEKFIGFWSQAADDERHRLRTHRSATAQF